MIYQISRTDDGEFVVIVSTRNDGLHGFVTGTTAQSCREWIKRHFGGV